MHIASDFLSFGFPSLKFSPSQYASHPVILRGTEGEVAESILPKDNPRPPGEGGPSLTTEGEGQTKTLSPAPHPFDGHLLPREKVFLGLLNSGFCNSGQALRAE